MQISFHARGFPSPTEERTEGEKREERREKERKHTSTARGESRDMEKLRPGRGQGKVQTAQGKMALADRQADRQYTTHEKHATEQNNGPYKCDSLRVSGYQPGRLIRRCAVGPSRGLVDLVERKNTLACMKKKSDRLEARAAFV
jgi:hypothetical protein